MKTMTKLCITPPRQEPDWTDPCKREIEIQRRTLELLMPPPITPERIESCRQTVMTRIKFQELVRQLQQEVASKKA